MGVGPEGEAGEPREGAPSRPERGAPVSRELSTRQRILAGAFIGTLFAVGMIARGDVAPGIVGGILAGILLFLVLREAGERNRRIAERRRR